MTFPTNRTFAKISENNQSVDRTIESLVDVASIRDELEQRPDRKQLEKTMRLMFLSSLILGERECESDDE